MSWKSSITGTLEELDWRKQKYSSCQLISAINARIYLGGGDISDEEFEELVDLSRCRYGAAICVEEAWPRLGLEVTNGPIPAHGTDKCYDWIKENLPVELCVRSPKFGLHSILVVATYHQHSVSNLLRFPTVRTINSDEETIEWAKLRKRFPEHAHNQRCRSFRLAESKASC